MFVMRAQHLRALDSGQHEAFVEALSSELAREHGAALRLSDAELRSSVDLWVLDARGWGIHDPENIRKYVNACARSGGRRLDFPSRLATFLRIYHERAARAVDVEEHVAETIDLAARHGITEEEAVTWLASILLAGRLRGEAAPTWVSDALGPPSERDEPRVRRVAVEARQRGWITEGTPR